MGIYKRGRFWWIAYGDGSGRQVRESSKSEKKTDAIAILEKKRTEVREGKNPILKRGKKIRFDEFAGDYLKEREGSKSFPFYRQIIKQLIPFFGKFHLNQISVALAKQYRQQRRGDDAAHRGKKVSPATINRELAVLRNSLNVAVENELLRFNPLAGQGKLFSKENERQYIYTDAEIAALIAEATEPLKSFIVLALNTGAREGEVMGLRWSEIDLSKRIITLTAIRTKGNRTRTIYMNDAVHRLLSERKLHRDIIRQKNEAKGKPKDEGTEYVFPNPSTGRPYRWISHEWKELLEKAKVNPAGRFHDLRHTWATRQAENGTPQADIRDMLGHRYSATTDRYMSGTDRRKREAVRLVQFDAPPGEIVELKKAK